MNKITLTIATLMLAANLSIAQTKDEIALLNSSVQDNLVNNILPFWANNTVDPDGGFYGIVIDRDKAIARADKGAIMNARILWTFARAFRSNPLKTDYKLISDRAADYYINHFIDKTYGGVYWSVNSKGKAKDMTKQTYAAAFGIYGLAEHYRATCNKTSLDAAKAIYRIIEEKTHDKLHEGYIETFRRNYSISKKKGVDGKEGATKTMNTHIHLLEAYTTLYQIWKTEDLRRNLLELIDILQHKLYSSQTKHLILFCDNNWNHLGQIDSYGHDIETSWLLTEAAEAIGDKEILASVKKQAVQMVDVALNEGINPEGAMIYEKEGYAYKRDLSWWPQCETVIGCVNAWQITGDSKYFYAAKRTWDYICNHFVDNTNRGWYKALTPDGTPKREPKASMWNCPYHNSRIAFELADRLKVGSINNYF